MGRGRAWGKSSKHNTVGPARPAHLTGAGHSYKAARRERGCEGVRVRQEYPYSGEIRGVRWGPTPNAVGALASPRRPYSALASASPRLSAAAPPRASPRRRPPRAPGRRALPSPAGPPPSPPPRAPRAPAPSSSLPVFPRVPGRRHTAPPRGPRAKGSPCAFAVHGAQEHGYLPDPGRIARPGGARKVSDAGAMPPTRAGEIREGMNPFIYKLGVVHRAVL